jgi:HEXXH motif-containing protein
VTTSLPAHPAASAEMLIHESSHLYVNVARRIDEVVNGEDTSLYDSPVKGVPRPLDRILIAYHAFANVALFYGACIERGLEDAGYCATNLARHRAELAILERPLARTRGLSPLGRHLFEPLAERLEQLP